MFSLCVCCFLDSVASSALCISRVGLSRTNGYDIWTGNKQQAEIARNLEPLASAWLRSIFSVYGSCLAGTEAGTEAEAITRRLRIEKLPAVAKRDSPASTDFAVIGLFFFFLYCGCFPQLI